VIRSAGSLAAVLLLAGCARHPAAPPARHVVLVTLDTTRADRLGCYGHAEAGTPWLDGLAARGTRFARAYSAVPLTLPSHVSILTGLYPAHTGVHANGETRMRDGVRTLQEILSAQGFFTAAAVGGYPVSHRFPVRRGFEAFDDRLTDPHNAAGLERDAGEVVRAALEELGARGQRRLFLWVHLYDPHDPYDPPSPFRERFSADPYQGEIARVDAALAELAAGLEQALHGESVLYCVLADHGEALGEHGEDTHGFFLYEPTVRIPFILAGPRVPQGVTRTDLASTVDVVPTVLSLIGLTEPNGLDGVPHDTSPEGERSNRRLALETELPYRNYGWSPLRSAVDGPIKLIDAPKAELYDVLQDPAEGRNLLVDQRGDAARLRTWIADTLGPRAAPDEASESIDPRLRSLGYVGAGSPPRDAAGPLADPKDRLGIYRRFTEASRALERGDARTALPALDALVAETDTPGVRFQRAAAYRMLGRFDDAQAELARVVAADPSYSGVHIEEMRVAVGRNDWAAARGEADACLHENPAEPEAFLYRGAALEFSGDTTGAEADYRRALDINPAFGNASLRLAALLVRAGRIDEAKALLRGHLALHPGDELARGLLGSI
jgi:arylsulfatase A-like enzyme